MKPDLTPLGFVCVTNEVNKHAPLLYRILTVYENTNKSYVVYVGQSKDAANPFYRYDANIRNKIEGKPPLSGSRFRPVHEDLHAAHTAKQKVIIELVRNVDPNVEDIVQAKATLQQHCGIDPGRLGRRLTAAGWPVGTPENGQG